jgi:hypothetical protein
MKVDSEWIRDRLGEKNRFAFAIHFHDDTNQGFKNRGFAFDFGVGSVRRD